MSSKPKQSGNEPAFPIVETDPQCGTRMHFGMTLRDYFASQTVIGIFSRTSLHFETQRQVAEYAYAMADAMLEARKDK